MYARGWELTVGAVPEERKVALFRDAAEVHIRRAREAGDAMGVDRHMFGRSRACKFNLKSLV